MSERPTIGVLMDYEAAGSFSKRPHYALRTAYFDAVWRAGGAPIALPYVSGAIHEFLTVCDGVITPGGSYPFPPAWYGETIDLVADQEWEYIPTLAFRGIKKLFVEWDASKNPTNSNKI